MISVNIQGNIHEPHLVFAVARRTNIPSFLTRAATSGALWSHSAWYDIDRGVMNEALVFKGVVETPIRDWVAKYPSHEFNAVAVPHPELGAEWRRSILGQGYDYLGALGVPWRADWQSEGRWYCSEADTMTCYYAGLQMFRDHHARSRHGVSPHEFWRATGRALTPLGRPVA